MQLIDNLLDYALFSAPDAPDSSERQQRHSALWENIERITGVRSINGVDIPQPVIDQLRRAGFEPAWMSPGMLEAAVQAAMVDCNVFDDPDGSNFFDDLDLSEVEREEEDDEIEPEAYRMGMHMHPDNFCEIISLTRAQKRRKIAAHEEDDAVHCGT